MLNTQDTEDAPKKTFILFRPFKAVWHWMFPPSVAHRDRQSPWARVAAVVFIVTLILGVVGYSISQVKVWREGYNTWKSNRLLLESKELEDAEKLTEAVNHANQAYLRAPENPAAVRALARYATMMRRNEARFLWGQLRKLGDMTEEDIEWEIQALSYLNEDKSVIGEIEKLLKVRKPTKRIIQVADPILVRTGKAEQLLGLLATYCQENPDDEDMRFIHSVRRMDFGDAAQKQAGLDEMWTMAALDNEMGLRAIDVLNRLTFKLASDQQRLISLLDAHPLAKEEHKIAALKRSAELDPNQKEAIIAKAIEDRRDYPKSELVPLTRWLNQEKKSAEILKLVPEDLAVSYPPLLENYLNALTVLERYKDLERIIQDPKTLLTSAEREFHKVHLAYITKKSPDEIEKALRTALDHAQAENKPLILMNLAKYSEDRGFPTIAENAYLTITRMPQSRIGGIEREAFESLIRLSYRNGNSKSFMDAASETARRWPDNQSFAERAIYASLLAGFELESAVGRAKTLLSQNQSDSQRKLLVALAYYRQLDPKAAVQYMQNIHLGDISVGQGAVLCGIMHLAGFNQQAEAIARQIPDTYMMLPEERRFLNLVRDKMR